MLRLEISYRGMLLVALALLSVWALIRLWPVILLVITAFIFMAAFLPYVEWLVRRGLPRTIAVLAMLALVLALIGGLFALVVPAMVDEFRDIQRNLPENAREAEDFLADFGIDVKLEQRARDIDWGDVISGEQAVNYGQRVVFTIVSIFTVIVMTAYLLIDTPRLSRFLYRFVPPGREPEVERILQSLSRVVGGYLRGQVITSIAITIYTFVVLLIVDVPNALAFAVLAGFVDIIPLIGALIATVLPTIAAFQESPEQAFVVLICLLAYQQFEDRVLVPRVYGQTLNLPPIVVLIAVLIGAELMGIPGVLLALPAAAAGRVFMEYALERWYPSAAMPPLVPESEALAPDAEPADDVG